MDKIVIRVYALIFNDNSEVLVLKEKYKNFKMTKFPGGGLEFGEGVVDCLKRELQEEFENLEIENISHFYTTDFFQVSAFNNEEQIISIYYKVNLKNLISLKLRSLNSNQDGPTEMFWLDLKEEHIRQFTFPIDKKVFKEICI
jgi:8-oxo-dGTP diphosphatase